MFFRKLINRISCLRIIFCSTIFFDNIHVMNVTQTNGWKDSKISTSALVRGIFSFEFLLFCVLGEDLSLALFQHYKIRKRGLFLLELPRIMFHVGLKLKSTGRNFKIWYHRQKFENLWINFIMIKIKVLFIAPKSRYFLKAPILVGFFDFKSAFIKSKHLVTLWI